MAATASEKTIIQENLETALQLITNAINFHKENQEMLSIEAYNKAWELFESILNNCESSAQKQIEQVSALFNYYTGTKFFQTYESQIWEQFPDFKKAADFKEKYKLEINVTYIAALMHAKVNLVQALLIFDSQTVYYKQPLTKNDIDNIINNIESIDTLLKINSESLMFIYHQNGFSIALSKELREQINKELKPQDCVLNYDIPNFPLRYFINQPDSFASKLRAFCQTLINTVDYKKLVELDAQAVKLVDEFKNTIATTDVKLYKNIKNEICNLLLFIQAYISYKHIVKQGYGRMLESLSSKEIQQIGYNEEHVKIIQLNNTALNGFFQCLKFFEAQDCTDSGLYEITLTALFMLTSLKCNQADKKASNEVHEKFHIFIKNQSKAITYLNTLGYAELAHGNFEIAIESFTKALDLIFSTDKLNHKEAEVILQYAGIITTLNNKFSRETVAKDKSKILLNLFYHLEQLNQFVQNNEDILSSMLSYCKDTGEILAKRVLDLLQGNINFLANSMSTLSQLLDLTDKIKQKRYNVKDIKDKRLLSNYQIAWQLIVNSERIFDFYKQIFDRFECDKVNTDSYDILSPDTLKTKYETKISLLKEHINSAIEKYNIQKQEKIKTITDEQKLILEDLEALCTQSNNKLKNLKKFAKNSFSITSNANVENNDNDVSQDQSTVSQNETVKSPAKRTLDAAIISDNIDSSTELLYNCLKELDKHGKDYTTELHALILLAGSHYYLALKVTKHKSIDYKKAHLLFTQCVNYAYQAKKLVNLNPNAAKELAPIEELLQSINMTCEDAKVGIEKLQENLHKQIAKQELLLEEKNQARKAKKLEMGELWYRAKPNQKKSTAQINREQTITDLMRLQQAHKCNGDLLLVTTKLKTSCADGLQKEISDNFNHNNTINISPEQAMQLYAAKKQHNRQPKPLILGNFIINSNINNKPNTSAKPGKVKTAASRATHKHAP